MHRHPAAAKLVGLLLFAVVVALTPRQAIPVFVAHALVAGVVIAIARLRVRLIVKRLLIITPFLVMAAIMPFVAEGEAQTNLLGRSMSVDGSWAAWNIVAKASLGAAASIVFAATTPIPEVITGLAKLRVPVTFVAIVSFMFRYLDLLMDQLRRMRSAMVSRCHDPRWLWQARPVASSAGTLFIRSYERGERVHQAMVARGYTGTMPTFAEEVVTRSNYFTALLPGLIAGAALIAAVLW